MHTYIYIAIDMQVCKRLFQWLSALIGAVYATQSFTETKKKLKLKRTTLQSDLPNANKVQTFWAGKV